MKSKRKSPRQVTLLTRIEGLLSDAVSGLSLIEKSVEKSARELLVAAEASVAKARDLIAKDVMAFAPGAPVRRSSSSPRRRRRAGGRRVTARRAR